MRRLDIKEELLYMCELDMLSNFKIEEVIEELKCINEMERIEFYNNVIEQHLSSVKTVCEFILEYQKMK